MNKHTFTLSRTLTGYLQGFSNSLQKGEGNYLHTRKSSFAQSAGVVEYIDFTSAERFGPTQRVSWYDTKQSNGEVPVMPEFWEMWSTPSLPSLPSPLWSGVVVFNRVLSMGQIELNCVVMVNWIAWNRTFLIFNCVWRKTKLIINWIIWIKTIWPNWIAWNRNVFDN